MVRRFSKWTLALVVALVAMGMAVGSALAAPAGGSAAPAREGRRIAIAYRVEQQRLKLQDARLGRASTYADKLDALIARQQAKGQDTTALEQAVAAFRAALAQARAEWQSASDTLAAHAGFDDAGKVSDIAQARATVAAAHEDMQQVHQIMHGAYKDLRAALVAYRKAHRTPAAPPAPVEP